MKLANLGAPARLTIAALAGVTALAVLPARAADNEDRHVRIINETNHTMLHFYASNVSVDSWQEDILGQDVLKPGQDVMINIDDGTGHCKYDFKAVFDDGEALVRRNLNVCELRSYRYTEDE